MVDNYPKLRADLIVSSDSESEQVTYTIKEPVTRRFFRLRAPEYYLLSRADGKTTIEEAARMTSERFGIKVPPAAAQAFFDKMERLLFFEGPALEREAPRLSRRTVVGERRSIGTIRLKAFDPDRLLDTWIQRVGFLFRAPIVGAALALMVLAGIIAAGQIAILGGNFTALWRLSSLPMLFGGILIVGFVHEFGHALTLKHFGGSVREMGFLLLYFQPCFYCNLSDAYLLNERRTKIYVGLSGLFFQGILTAVFILLLRVIEPSTLISQFLQVAVAFSLAVFLFNFNPLIRLDGYYLLADWLRIPNLRARAFAYWRNTIAVWCFGHQATHPRPNRRLRFIYNTYGVLASIYTALLLGWVVFHVTNFVHTHWGVAGNAILYGTVLFFALRKDGDEREAASSDSADDTAPSPPPRRWKKPVLLWGGLALLIAIMALVKVDHHVGSPCRVEPSARFTVSSTVMGTLETELFEGYTNQRRDHSILLAVSADFSTVDYSLKVSEGDIVQPGDTVLVLSSNLFLANLRQKESEREQTIAERNLLLSDPKRDQVLALRAEIEEIDVQLETKKTEAERADQLMARELIARENYEAIQTELRVLKAQQSAKSSEMALLISGPKAEELAVKEAQIGGLDAAISFLRSQIAASIVQCPIGGIVTRVSRGSVLAEVAELDPVRVQLDVEERDIADVELENPVSLKVRAWPFERFEGHVTQVALDADTTGGTHRFGVVTHITNTDGLLKPGMTGYGKIVCGKHSILTLTSRRLVHFFRVEFWSWW